MLPRGSGKWQASDVACPSETSAIVASVKGRKSKALEEAGSKNTVANQVSDGDAAHVSSASMIEIMTTIEMSSRKNHIT
jgi:hypothetical protein